MAVATPARAALPHPRRLNAAAREEMLRRLLRRRHLAAAERFCRAWSEFDPAAEAPVTARAALLHHAGRREEASGLTRGYFANHPLRLASDAGGRPAILKLRCLDRAYYMLGERSAGGLKVKLRGGHFSTAHLLARGRLAVHRLTVIGETPPAVALPPAGLALNTLGDADMAPEGLHGLARLLAAHPDLPVINRPERVALTGRDANHRRIDPLPGFAFPRTERFRRRPETTPAAAADEVTARAFGWPLIVRETGTQTARSVALIGGTEELAAYFAGTAAEEFYLIAFRDCAMRGPDGGRWYNKKRMFAIDGRLFPVVSHIDGVWNVHGSNRLKVMAANPWMMEQERAFLENPKAVLGAAAYARLEGLVALVGLEWFGFDFTQLDDGTLLVFELNAAMRHSYRHAANFRYMRPHMDAIGAAFQRMIETRLK